MSGFSGRPWPANSRVTPVDYRPDGRPALPRNRVANARLPERGRDPYGVSTRVRASFIRHMDRHGQDQASHQIEHAVAAAKRRVAEATVRRRSTPAAPWPSSTTGVPKKAGAKTRLSHARVHGLHGGDGDIQGSAVSSPHSGSSRPRHRRSRRWPPRTTGTGRPSGFTSVCIPHSSSPSETSVSSSSYPSGCGIHHPPSKAVARPESNGGKGIEARASESVRGQVRDSRGGAVRGGTDPRRVGASSSTRERRSPPAKAPPVRGTTRS